MIFTYDIKPNFLLVKNHSQLYSSMSVYLTIVNFIHFYDLDWKFLCILRIGIKPARGRITMMPIGTPRVPYRVPGEGTWQWVDLWNALVSCYLYFL